MLFLMGGLVVQGQGSKRTKQHGVLMRRQDAVLSTERLDWQTDSWLGQADRRPFRQHVQPYLYSRLLLPAFLLRLRILLRLGSIRTA